MGILNLTPDSFSDGGRFLARDAALSHAGAMVEAGAAIIDIGGESTRPGAQPVSVDEELARVVPVIEALAGEIPAPISVDTSKPEVMREAVAAGAGLVNDVLALRQEGAVETAARLQVPICLMHMQGEPRTMQQDPQYRDVVSDVAAFLAERVAVCEAAGIGRERLLLDPGFGFGKTLEHNLSLLKHLNQLESLGLPLLVGVSRKSMIYKSLKIEPADALNGTSVLNAVALLKKANILRVHDVKEAKESIELCKKLV